MSNHLAIATVGAALRQIVLGAVNDAVIGSVAIQFGRPPPTPVPPLLVNIYLYRVSPSAALRNIDLPTRSTGGQLAQRARAALSLHYLISFYGDSATHEPERMLAAVVRDLHAMPIIDAQLIADAVAGSSGTLDTSDLAQAEERVRFSMDLLSLDELARLWSMMIQSPHAVSVAYAATPILLDARNTAAAALPVLQRGQDDRGFDTRLGPFPQLTTAWIGFPAALEQTPRPPSLRAAQFGTVLLIDGNNLGGDIVTLSFSHPPLPTVDIVIPAADRDAQRLRLTLTEPPLNALDWAPGLYGVVATITIGSSVRTTPLWPLLVAPHIVAIAKTAGVGDILVSITCTPPVRITQSASLRIGDREAIALDRIALSDPLEFRFASSPALTNELAWLRVDGAESMPFMFDVGTSSYVFDPAQRVTLP